MNDDVKLFLACALVFFLGIGYYSLDDKYQLLITVHVAVFIMTIFAYKAMENLLFSSEEPKDTDPN